MFTLTSWAMNRSVYLMLVPFSVTTILKICGRSFVLAWITSAEETASTYQHSIAFNASSQISNRCLFIKFAQIWTQTHTHTHTHTDTHT